MKLGCTDDDTITGLRLMSHIFAVGQAQNWFNYWLGAEPLVIRIAVIEYYRTNNLNVYVLKKIMKYNWWYSITSCHMTLIGRNNSYEILAILTKTVNIIIHCVSWLQVRCRMWRGLQTHQCMQRFCIWRWSWSYKWHMYVFDGTTCAPSDCGPREQKTEWAYHTVN